MKANLIVKIYFLVLFLELLGELLFDFYQIPYLIFFFKPLLMPILIYWYKKSDAEALNTMVFALAFSFLGDLFLMFTSFSEHFFLAGLASFLITHILYLYLFVLKTTEKKRAIFWKRPHLTLPFILYGASLLAFLAKEGTADFAAMKTPVIVYSTVIILMVLAAIARFDKVNQKSFAWVLIGAFLFMFSDSFIALKNFSSFFDGYTYLARISIMSLYAIGQYLIVKGFLEQQNNKTQMAQTNTYIDETNLKFKGKKFSSTEEYFKYMIKELGFPDIFHFFESKKIETNDGLKLNIDIQFYAKDAPTIVFVPGTSVYGLCFAGLLHRIGKEGYNIVALDPRGHGRSEGKRGDYTIEELMLDVRTVVKYAKETFNDKVTVFGNSQGGIVSFYLAAEGIEADSIICQNFADLDWEDTYKLARFPFLAKMGKPFINGIGKMVPNLTVSTLTYLDLKKIKIKYFDNLHNFIVEDPFTVSKISMRAARSLVMAKMAKPVEEITIPVFVFQGDADRVFPLQYTKDLFARIKSKKKMKVYPDCDHGIMVENEDLVLPDILDWLKEIYPKQ